MEVAWHGLSVMSKVTSCGVQGAWFLPADQIVWLPVYLHSDLVSLAGSEDLVVCLGGLVRWFW